MAATFVCPSCGRQGSLKNELPSHAKLRCPDCKTLFAPHALTEDDLMAVLEMQPAGAVSSANNSSSRTDPNGHGSLSPYEVAADIPPVPPVMPTHSEPDQPDSHSKDFISVSANELPVLPAAVHLGYIRKQTCYRSLRILVGIFTYGLITISILFFVFSCVMTGIMYNYGIGLGAIAIAVTGLLVCLAGCFLAIAMHQATSLMIDITDLLIDQGRKQRQP